MTPHPPSRRMLFLATALIEAGAGLSLLGLPAIAIRFLLGVQPPSPEALVVSRVCGAGLLAIGVACWLARDDRGSRAQQGLLTAVIVYNVGACAVLVWAGAVLSMAGLALWPGVGLHAGMTIWCVMSLRAGGGREN